MVTDHGVIHFLGIGTDVANQGHPCIDADSVFEDWSSLRLPLSQQNCQSSAHFDCALHGQLGMIGLFQGRSPKHNDLTPHKFIQCPVPLKNHVSHRSEI